LLVLLLPLSHSVGGFTTKREALGLNEANMNYHRLLQLIIFASLFLLLLVGCSAPVTPTATATLEPPIATETLTPPPSNAVYIGTAQGKNVIFVTYALQQALYKDTFSSEEYLGKIYCGGFDFNFNDLEVPRLLFSIANIDNGISVICSDGNVYISGVRQEPGSGDVSFVVVVYPETGDFQEVWTGMPGYVDEIRNHIIVIKLLSCYRCSPSPLRKTVLVNANTGAEKELGEVGDVRILNSSVAYRYLAPLEVPCDPGEGCDGFYIDYEPIGEFLLEPLP
jgi:hypothetical protein